jgi:hypothetical protein
MTKALLQTLVFGRNSASCTSGCIRTFLLHITKHSAELVLLFVPDLKDIVALLDDVLELLETASGHAGSVKIVRHQMHSSSIITEKNS